MARQGYKPPNTTTTTAPKPQTIEEAVQRFYETNPAPGKYFIPNPMHDGKDRPGGQWVTIEAPAQSLPTPQLDPNAATDTPAAVMRRRRSQQTMQYGFLSTIKKYMGPLGGGQQTVRADWRGIIPTSTAPNGKRHSVGGM